MRATWLPVPVKEVSKRIRMDPFQEVHSLVFLRDIRVQWRFTAVYFFVVADNLPALEDFMVSPDSSVHYLRVEELAGDPEWHPLHIGSLPAT